MDVTRQVIQHFAVTRPQFLEENWMVATAKKQKYPNPLPGRETNIFMNTGSNMEVLQNWGLNRFVQTDSSILNEQPQLSLLGKSASLFLLVPGCAELAFPKVITSLKSS